MADILRAQEIDDLVVGTLEDLGRDKIVQIAQNNQDYEIYSHWFKKGKVAFDGGTGIKRTLMAKLPTAARHIGLYATDDVKLEDLLTSMSIDWRHATTSWTYETREMMMNKGKARINNIIKPRREGAVLNLIEQIETKCWSLPALTNETDPYGIPYWVVYHATEGFTGAAPSGHTTVAGVNPTTYPTWKNWSANYTNVSKDDLITKMRKGQWSTKWKSPINIGEFRGDKGSRYRFYTEYDVLAAFETLGEAQNENLGRDLASMDGQMTFRRHPLIAVPELDGATGGPVYGIDHECFMAVCLEGDYLRESAPAVAPNQHNARQCFIDLTYNLLCLDRRRQMIFRTA